MKTFLFMIFMTLPLALCSKDNDEPKQDFVPVTLDLSGLNIQEDDTSFTVNGFKFSNVGSFSQDYSTLDNNNEIINFNGLTIWYDGTDLHYIELLLDNIEGISKITVKVFNNGTTTLVTIYNGNDIVEENQAPYRVNDVVFDVKNKVIDKLRISSAEGAAISIKLE